MQVYILQISKFRLNNNHFEFNTLCLVYIQAAAAEAANLVFHIRAKFKRALNHTGIR